MSMIRWIPVCEQMPEPGRVVVACQFGRGSPRIFAGWLQDDPEGLCWYSCVVGEGTSGATLVAEFGDVRATDFWLPLPKEPPDHNVVDGGWPA